MDCRIIEAIKRLFFSLKPEKKRQPPRFEVKEMIIYGGQPPKRAPDYGYTFNEINTEIIYAGNKWERERLIKSAIDRILLITKNPPICIKLARGIMGRRSSMLEVWTEPKDREKTWFMGS
jgi:hypothetical protein